MGKPEKDNTEWCWSNRDSNKPIGGGELIRELLKHLSPIGKMPIEERRKYFEKVARIKWLKWKDAKEYVELSLLSFDQDLTKEQHRMKAIYCLMMEYGFTKKYATEYIDIKAIPKDNRTPEQQQKYLEISGNIELIDCANDFCLDHP